MSEGKLPLSEEQLCEASKASLHARNVAEGITVSLIACISEKASIPI